MNKTENLELVCRGRQYVKWSTPVISTRFSVSDCSGSGLFCSTLLITNATVNETGSYQCSYKDMKAEDGKTSASVYVFVHDYKTPFVPSEKDYEAVFIHEGVKVVIPCRGSVDNLNVTLHTKYPNKELYLEGKDSAWDAQRGFTVPSHLISYAGVVFCQTCIGNETFKSTFYIVAVVGYKIYNLTLSPSQVRLTELNVGMEFNWTHSGHALKKLWNSLELSNTLTVDSVTVEHSGEYTCSASSGLMEKSATATLQVYGEENITLVVFISTCITLFRLKNGFPLKDDYRIKQKSDALVIREVKEMDAGNYTMILTNKITKEEQRRSFQLLVIVPPHIIEKEVAVDTDVYPFGSSPTLWCTVRGVPTPAQILWEWMPKEDCPDRISTNTDSANKVHSLKIKKAEEHGLYRCVAANTAGEDSRIIFFHVTRGLELSVSPPDELLEEDDVLLRCKADRHIYGNLAWFRVLNMSDPVASVLPCRSLVLQPAPFSQTVLSQMGDANMTLDLLLPRASTQDQGVYACQVQNNKSGDKTCLLRRITLKEAFRHAPFSTLNLTEQKVNVSTTVSFVCDAAGTPKPTVIWTKNNHTVLEGSGVILSKDNGILTIQRVKKEDSGLYTCTACNSRGCDVSQAFLTTEGVEEKTNVELIVPIGSVVIAMFFWLLIVFVIRGRKRSTGGDLKTGYLSMILDAEDMPTDEQCERLAYDANKWEFPRDRLKLGEPLGRGAFGQVVEAAAFGIEKATTCTTVAVKMLKEGATASEYRALMSELKILIHIGHYLNVVNLLGACTKPGGPLMVIVEYCKHGNLSSYLKSKRGEYSPYKVSAPQRWARSEEDITEGDLGLGKVAQLDICTGTAVCSSAGDRASNNTMDCPEESSDEDHLTMEDLISYSFQVAKGMEFLSSRKCIHRDLAARNILLSENNVVKICDFGLARDVYKDPDYVRKGDARLPLKWMAPETIFDRVYTTQSDVWSFGVLLWEIFSLGASPYPGVCIDESFCRRLKEGTRMRPPEYATTEIYQTMLDCWLDRPTDRPTFAELVEHLGNLLQASAQQDGKDYIPVTEACPLTSDTKNLYSSPRSEEALAAQLHYDHPLSIASVYLHFVNQLLRCKSKESLGSESSNQTSGYQSGYHSDDAETPIYANEEMLLAFSLSSSPLWG
uniref:receptor protein-tyrosine kinase n=1 Tax=Neogobius melanostomus TaxID=47308 RepID=A0A8C6UFV0_9GOBI